MAEEWLSPFLSIISGGIVAVFSVCIAHHLTETRHRKENHISNLKDKMIKPLLRIFENDISPTSFKDRCPHIEFDITDLNVESNTGEIKFFATKNPLNFLIKNELYIDLNNHFPELYGKIEEFNTKFLSYTENHRKIAQYFWNNYNGEISKSVKSAEKIILTPHRREILVRKGKEYSLYPKERLQKELRNIWQVHYHIFGLALPCRDIWLGAERMAESHVQHLRGDIDKINHLANGLSKRSERILQLLQIAMEQQKLKGKCKYV